jgi:hypothetical protein
MLAPLAFESISIYRLLNAITVEALCLMRERRLKLLNETKYMYLGRWERVEIDKSQFSHLASEIELAPLSIEIIKSFDDMSDHLHYHDDADAIITILGNNEGYEDPQGCKMYFKSRTPLDAVAGITLQIPRRTVHSFSGGVTPVVFLSVQSKKIDADYHLINGSMM